jgi:hypothetical protein
MLFYEPLFLTIFPAFYAFYLLATGAPAKKWTLLFASTLFYIWGEPVFVLVLLASTAIDYALSFHLNDPTPLQTRRLALTAGIVGNIAILIVYKYADFLAENLNLALAPLGSERIPLLHLALPIGVSFVVFEKITYLVDTYRGTSRPAARFSDYCLFVLFFPKLLAGPILKYHEMKDQIAKPPAVEWSDFGTGYLRFARGLGRKLLIADPLGAFVNQIFAADPASLSAAYAWLGLSSFTLQIYFDFAGYSDMAIGSPECSGFASRRISMRRISPIDHRVLEALAHFADHLDPRLSLHAARWQPSRRSPHLRQPLDLFPGLRTVARRKLEFCHLGRLQWIVPHARSHVPARSARAIGRFDLDCRHAFHRDDRLGDFPFRLARASPDIPVGTVWNVACAKRYGNSGGSAVHPGAGRRCFVAAGDPALCSVDRRL